MSLSIVQSNAAAVISSTISMTMTSSVTSGNTMVVGVVSASSFGAVAATLSDNQGNTYTQRQSNFSTGGAGWVQLFDGPIGSSGTLTLTCPGGFLQTTQILAAEVSGGAVYANSSFTAGDSGQTSISSGSITFSGTGLAFGVTFSSVVPTASGGYSSLQASNVSGYYAAMSDLSGASSPADPTFTCAANFDWAVVGAVYTGAGAGTTATLSVTAPDDSFSGSAALATPSTFSKTAPPDIFSASASVRASAALSKTSPPDTFSGSATVHDTGSLATTQARDTASFIAAFVSHAILASTASPDSFAGSTHLATSAGLSAREGADAFSGTAFLGNVASLTVTAKPDSLQMWVNVTPRLVAITPADSFAGSASATSGAPHALAATESPDVFSGVGGFSFDANAVLSVTENPDSFAGTTIQSSAGVLGVTEAADAFIGYSGVRHGATLSVVAAPDRFSGGAPERVAYHIYASPSSGDPIDYSTVIATETGTTWTSPALSAPGTYSFAARAFYVVSGLEEQNIDCAVTITIDAAGQDISNQPYPPTGLRAFATLAGGIRVEWSGVSPNAVRAATGYAVFATAGSTVSYASPAVTVSAAASIANTFQVNLSGYSDGQLVSIGVRAFNAVAQEKNVNFVTVTASAVGPAPVVGLMATTIV